MAQPGDSRGLDAMVHSARARACRFVMTRCHRALRRVLDLCRRAAARASLTNVELLRT